MAEERAFFDDASPESVAAGTKTASSSTIEEAPKFRETSTSRYAAIIPRLFFSAVAFAIFATAAWLAQSMVLAIAAIFAGILAFSCCHVVLEWERAVVVRCGKIHRIAEPGLIFTLPFIDGFASIVDMRIRSTAFKAEHVLTSDLVPVNVDAVLFWGVFDAKRASIEVRNYEQLVFWVAQTTLRDVMGSISISELSTRRVQIDKEVASILERKTSDWGITVESVEIRDIVVPDELQEALSVEARAKQEHHARIIRAEAEREAADMFLEAARTYGDEGAALQLRGMDFVYEGVKERGGLVVIPSSLSQAFDGFNDLLSK